MKQWVLNLTMGLALMAGGGWLVYAEMSEPPVHSGHLYVGIGVAMLGALLVNPTPIITSVKQIVVIIAPIIPWSKVAQAKRDSASVPIVPSDKSDPG